jgi:hypothetical protein
MRDLYRAAWAQLAHDRATLAELEPEATPVLAFGQWRGSRVVTAGLNPSEIEFRASDGSPLTGDRQRFLHWPADDALTEERLEAAFARSEGYFTLGNCYARWFNRYNAFLDGVGVSFASGTACHTDYLSPFATRTGIARCSRRTQRRLAAFGYLFWLRVLSALPRAEVIFGHGSGWRAMPALLGFEHWEPLATPFDRKGGGASVSRPFLLFQEVLLPPGERRALVYWWRPNRDGGPLGWLNTAERSELGQIVRAHAQARGALVEERK